MTFEEWTACLTGLIIGSVFFYIVGRLHGRILKLELAYGLREPKTKRKKEPKLKEH